MKDEAPSSPTDGSDWMALLAKQVGSGVPEIDLRTIGEGDVLVVSTKNTRYAFRWLKDGYAELLTSRGEGRPSGRVQVHGCGFGQSSSLKPEVLFCAGNMEYVSEGGALVHRTTVILALQLLRRTG